MKVGDSSPSAIELKEYEYSEHRLTENELEGLQRLLPSLGVRVVGDGLFSLNPGGLVGVGSVGGRGVFVEPKLDISKVLFLVGYALDPFRWSDTSALLDYDADLFDAMCEMFIRTLSRAMERGLPRGYSPRAEVLPTIRGRISFQPFLKERYARMPPIDCEFDEHSEDIEINHLLKAALHTLLHLTRSHPETFRNLHSLQRRFSQVTDVTYRPSAVPSIVYSRLFNHYKPAVELARAILKHSSLLTRHGSIEIEGFFLNLADVFEEFVLVALRQALRLDAGHFPPAKDVSLDLDSSGRVGLEPDLSWWDSGQCLFIGDVKYKRTPGITGVQHPDIYQLLAYTQATNLDWGLLVYAAGEAEDTKYEIRHSVKTIDVMTLDLNEPPRQILLGIARIAERIRDNLPGSPFLEYGNAGLLDSSFVTTPY